MGQGLEAMEGQDWWEGKASQVEKTDICSLSLKKGWDVLGVGHSNNNDQNMEY